VSRCSEALAHSANVVEELLQIDLLGWQSEGDVRCRVTALGLGGGVVVVVGAAVGIVYGCGSVAISTERFIVKKKPIVEGIAFIFGTRVAGVKCDTWGVRRRKGGFAVDGGDRHGEVAAGSDSYGGSRRLEYRVWNITGDFCTFRTIFPSSIMTWNLTAPSPLTSKVPLTPVNIGGLAYNLSIPGTTSL